MVRTRSRHYSKYVLLLSGEPQPIPSSTIPRDVLETMLVRGKMAVVPAEFDPIIEDMEEMCGASQRRDVNAFIRGEMVSIAQHYPHRRMTAEDTVDHFNDATAREIQTALIHNQADKQARELVPDFESIPQWYKNRCDGMGEDCLKIHYIGYICDSLMRIRETKLIINGTRRPNLSKDLDTCKRCATFLHRHLSSQDRNYNASIVANFWEGL